APLSRPAAPPPSDRARAGGPVLSGQPAAFARDCARSRFARLRARPALARSGAGAGGVVASFDEVKRDQENSAGSGCAHAARWVCARQAVAARVPVAARPRFRERAQRGALQGAHVRVARGRAGRHRRGRRRMRLQLIAAWAAGLVCASGGLARAQDVTQQVDVHGFYYKETSTRVVQPRMEVLAQIPRTSSLVGAEYSLDAISSASIAAGNRVSDNILTEYRNQVGARVVQSLNRLRLPVPARVGANYLRSRESDYDSDTVGGQA